MKVSMLDVGSSCFARLGGTVGGGCVYFNFSFIGYLRTSPFLKKYQQRRNRSGTADENPSYDRGKLFAEGSWSLCMSLACGQFVRATLHYPALYALCDE